jgi:hypothetical protein
VRNLATDLEDAGSRARHLIRDRDGKYTPLFDTILTDTGITVVCTGVRMPRMMRSWKGGSGPAATNCSTAPWSGTRPTYYTRCASRPLHQPTRGDASGDRRRTATRPATGQRGPGGEEDLLDVGEGQVGRGGQDLDGAGLDRP